MTDGVADLLDLKQAGIARVELACRRCTREGNYSVEGLLQRYGPKMRMTELRHRIAADCPKQGGSASIYDRCGVHYPNAEDWSHVTGRNGLKPQG